MHGCYLPGLAETFWGALTTCSEQFWPLNWGKEMIESSSLLAFGIFFSACDCIIAGKTLNIFLVQERQNLGGRWIGSVLLCHIWLQRREVLHVGYVCLKNL